MENRLASSGRSTSPPQNIACPPKLFRADQWTVVLGSLISLFGFLSEARATTSVKLAWDPSGASGIAGYRLYYGTASLNYSQSRDLGNTTTATVSNLLPGRGCYFAVTGYDTCGAASVYSN